MTLSKPSTFLVGRSKECDVVLADPTVSRQHVQFVVKSANDLMLVDCDSKFGTFVQSGNDWRRITTTRVQPDDRIRLGQYETTIKAIMAVVAPRLPPQAPGAASPKPQHKPQQERSAPSSRTVVERDPETGEIVTRKEP
jgi:predicted component of type VI protein secretion system